MKLQLSNLASNPEPIASARTADPAAILAFDRPAIEFRGVSKSYETITALDNVSFRIARGQVVALVGPNGAGKSTCVEIIMGLRAADSGSVVVGNDNVTRGDRGYIARLGVQLQETRFFPNLTGREYLDFFAALYDHSIDRRVLIDQLDLGAFVNQRMGKMSGGQRQRIALALAIINDPEIVILDEPTVGLDPIARREFWSIIKRLHADGNRTLLFSTHYMEEAAAIASHVLMLAAGTVIASGRVDDVVGQARDGGATNLDDAYNVLVGQTLAASHEGAVS